MVLHFLDYAFAAAGCSSCLDLRSFRLELEGLSVGVVALLLLVQLLDDLVDRQGVQVLGDEVQEEPVADLLQVGQGRWLQDGLDVGPLGRLSALNKRIIDNLNLFIDELKINSDFTSMAVSKYFGFPD